VRVGTAVAIGCALVATSACGFLSLDGLTGGDAGQSNQGSSSSGGDDAPAGDSDNVSPEATPDVDPARDASPDRTMGGDAGPTKTWCMQLSPAPAFCADYDEGQLLGAFAMGSMFQVPAPNLSGGGLVSLDKTNPSSPPASCASEADVVGDADVTARFENPVTITNTDSARLRFDMRIDADDPNQAYVADVFFNNGSNQEYVQLSIAQGGGFVRWQGTLTSKKAFFTEPAVGVWTKDIELTGNVKTGTLDLQIGGQSVSLTASLPFNTSDSSTFYIGLHCFAGSKRITFDNVVFTPGP
jgi:hypothetical protein